MSRYTIEFERDKCIGAMSCNEKCSSNWEMKSDGKSNYKKGTFDDDNLECNMNAAKACPVNAIHIIDSKKDKKLI
jgi:ferredoxin